MLQCVMRLTERSELWIHSLESESIAVLRNVRICQSNFPKHQNPKHCSLGNSIESLFPSQYSLSCSRNSLIYGTQILLANSQENNTECYPQLLKSSIHCNRIFKSVTLQIAPSNLTLKLPDNICLSSMLFKSEMNMQSISSNVKCYLKFCVYVPWYPPTTVTYIL